MMARLQAADTPVLWHIPLSHYNEKVRWTLDYKGIAHRREFARTDYLFQAWRATGQGKLPILFLDGRAVADSTAIIAALEARYPEPALYPRDPAARERALALEDYFDEQVGPAVRAAIVTPLFRHDPDTALRLLMTGMPDQAYRSLRPLLRVFPAYYRFRHRITAKELDRDRAAVAAGLDRIEAERQPSGYLVGETFTVADLTAVSMFAALLELPEIQYPVRVPLPAYHREYRDSVARHPAARWIADVYRRHRSPSAELPRERSTR